MTDPGFSVVVRADADVDMGLGHVMRCLTLADALSERGARVTFVSRRMPGHIRELLAERGHGCRMLTSPPQPPDASVVHSAWLQTSQAADAEETVAAVPEGCDWLLVDHYGISAPWETAARVIARRVLALDDLADRAHAADAVLDQNLYPGLETRYDGLVRDDCALLLGPGYALLRPEFAEVRETISIRNGRVRRVLVLLGGVDAGNFTEVAVGAIHALSQPLVVDVVVGATHPASDRIRSMCAEFGYEFHVQTRQVAQLMAVADLSVGATGATSWERCCLGVPTVGVTLAANQVPIAQALASAGAITNLGDARALTVENVVDALNGLIREPSRVAEMSAAAWAVVDGHGAARATDYILAA